MRERSPRDRLVDSQYVRLEWMPKKEDLLREPVVEPPKTPVKLPAAIQQIDPEEIATLIKRVAAAGTTVVLVEHNMRLVMGVSDHILVLDHGRRLAEGTAERIRHDPRVIEAYLGAAAHSSTLGEAEAAHA